MYLVEARIQVFQMLEIPHRIWQLRQAVVRHVQDLEHWKSLSQAARQLLQAVPCQVQLFHSPVAGAKAEIEAEAGESAQPRGNDQRPGNSEKRLTEHLLHQP